MAKQRIKIREHRPEAIAPQNNHEEEDYLMENPLLTSPFLEMGGSAAAPPPEDPNNGNPFGPGNPLAGSGLVPPPPPGAPIGGHDDPFSATVGFGSGLYGELGPEIQKQAQQMQMLVDQKRLRSQAPPALDLLSEAAATADPTVDSKSSEELGDQTAVDPAAQEQASNEAEQQESQDTKDQGKEQNDKEAENAADAKAKEAQDVTAEEGGGESEQAGADQAPEAPAVGEDAPKVTPNVAGLPGDIAAKLQSVLGMDVSKLKIVTDSAEAVKHKAKAMAKGGNEMHFAPGEFNPNSDQGKFKIGHEGGHLKAQSEGGVEATGEELGQKVNTSSDQESYADSVGKMMTQDSPSTAPEAPSAPAAEIKPVTSGDSIAQFMRVDYGGFENLLSTAEGAKNQNQASVDASKTSFQSAIDAEKQNVQTTLESEANKAAEIVDGGAEKLSEVKDTVISDTQSSGEDKLARVETAVSTETENVTSMVDGKKEELTSAGDTFAGRLEKHGESEASRMESKTSTNASEMANAVSSAKGAYSNKEGVDELASKLESKASEASSKLQEFSTGVSNAVRNDGTSNAEKVRTEATEGASQLDGAKEKGTEAIDKKKEDSNTAIQGNTEQFVSSAESEASSAITQVQSGSGEIKTHIMSMGEGIGQQMDKAASEMGTALDTANQKAMSELDTFLNDLSDVGWNAELMGQIAADVSAALAEHQSQMTSFVEENKGKVTQVSGSLQEATGGVVQQVQTEVDKAAEEFKTGLETKKTEIESENERVASEAETQMASVTTNMEPEISNTISESEGKWEENVSEVETDMTGKVDDGLEEQSSVVSDFKSEVTSSFEELPIKKEDKGILESIWDGVKSVASFIGGVFEGFAMAIVKIFTGLWDLLKMLTDPLMLLLAVVAVIVAALVLFGIAALAGVTVGTVLLVIGAIFGVGMMAFCFYKAFTAEGLSARERGNLVGEGLFEGATAFMGTGMLARFGKWAGQIGKARHLVNAAGGLPQFLRMAAFVDDIPRLTRLMEAGADMGQISRLLGMASDGKQAAAILDLVDTVGDLGQVSKLLDYTQDAGRIMNFFRKGIGPGKLLDVVAASGDASRVMNALDNVGDTRRLVDLLGQAKDVPGVLNLIENGGDANKVMDLLESIPNKRQLNALIAESGGDVNKLENLINGADNGADLSRVENAANAGADVAAVENTTDIASDAAKVENTTDVASDAAKVETVVDNAGDASKVENAVDTASDASKVENATDTASDASKVENATDTASDASKVEEGADTASDAGKVDDVETAPKPEGLSEANSAAYDRLTNSGLKPQNNGGNVEFVSDQGRVVAEIKDGNLVFKYEGFGGDIVMDPNKTTTFLGKFVEDADNPLVGTKYFLGSDRFDTPIPGLPEGSFSRGAGKAPNNNGLNSLDIPEDEYLGIINRNIENQRNLPENAGLSPKEIEAKGWEAGNNEFWDKYNEPFLEDAFVRGDNVRLISDPKVHANGTYARELAAIEGPNGLAAKYGYTYDAATSSYVKTGGGPNPNALDNVLGTTSDVSKAENAVDASSDAARVEDAANSTPTDGSSNPLNTNKNGGIESASGGGMRGADVYETASKGSKQRISQIGDSGAISGKVDEALQATELPHGATVSRPPNTKSTFEMQVGGQQVEISMRYHDSNTKWGNASTGAVHGTDQGAGLNKVSYDPSTGKFTAEVHVNGMVHADELDKIAVHEFHEIADIVHIQSGKLDEGGNVADLGKFNEEITSLQEASVFKPDTPGGTPVPVRADQLSAHDRAAAQELQMVINEVNTYLSTADASRAGMRDPREKLNRLLRSMGIEDMGNPRIDLLKNELGLTIPSQTDEFLYTSLTPIARVVPQNAVEAQVLALYNGHVKRFDGFGADGGIGGAHDDLVFRSLEGQYYQLTGPPANGSQPGILEYSYQMFARDGAGNSTGTLRTQVYQKTTYDPSVWPDERIITTTSEAFQDAISSGGLNASGSWTGFDSNGIEVSGFYKGDVVNPQITTFWIGTP